MPQKLCKLFCIPVVLFIVVDNLVENVENFSNSTTILPLYPLCLYPSHMHKGMNILGYGRVMSPMPPRFFYAVSSAKSLTFCNLAKKYGSSSRSRSSFFVKNAQSFPLYVFPCRRNTVISHLLRRNDMPGKVETYGVIASRLKVRSQQQMHDLLLQSRPGNELARQQRIPGIPMLKCSAIFLLLTPSATIACIVGSDSLLCT